MMLNWSLSPLFVKPFRVPLDFQSLILQYSKVCYKSHINLFCCSKCGPRLSEEAAQMLKNRYVLMRSGARDYERDAEKKINIPITVR